MIATQRIEQLEMELQRNNAKPQQEYPHVQYPHNQNAYRNEAADMKVWLLEQKLRQLELDVHRNNNREVCSISVSFCKFSMIAFSDIFVFCVIPVRVG
jgi:hypothetical protein